MRHLLHKPSPTGKYKSALLIKESCLDIQEIEKHYIVPLVALGYSPDDIFSWNLKYNQFGKAPVKFMKAYLTDLLRALDNQGVTTLFVADTAYFKVLTKLRKAEPHYGYIKQCAIEDYSHMNVILSVNYQALFYNPKLQDKLDWSLRTMMNSLTGLNIEPGSDIIHSFKYINDPSEMRQTLKDLKKHPELVVDIETRGLELKNGMLGTIGFAWDKHNGIVFDISMDEVEPYIIAKTRFLKKFFEEYKGKCIYHGATFDIKILIFELYMNGIHDRKGMLRGLEVMTKDIDCTLLMTYLATNTTAGNKLDLKSNSIEFAGNYAQDDIEDIEKIHVPDLLKYNLTDCLATWFVHGKYLPIVKAEGQMPVYEDILRPMIKLVVKMELTGMPLDMKRVQDAKTILGDELYIVEQYIKQSLSITNFVKRLKLEAVILKNAELKKKVIDETYFDDLEFNPNSNKQVAHLLHDHLKLDVIDRTPTKQPSVGAGTLKKHLSQLKSKFKLTDEELK